MHYILVQVGILELKGANRQVCTHKADCYQCYHDEMWWSSLLKYLGATSCMLMTGFQSFSNFLYFVSAVLMGIGLAIVLNLLVIFRSTLTNRRPRAGFSVRTKNEGLIPKLLFIQSLHVYREHTFLKYLFISN